MIPHDRTTCTSPGRTGAAAASSMAAAAAQRVANPAGASPAANPAAGPAANPAGRTVVVGLGRTGMSCVRYLRSRGMAFAVTDNRAEPPEAKALQRLAPEAPTRFGAFDESLLDGAAQVLASPGVSLAEPFLASALRRGLPVMGDIELFAREARAPVVAITGTNGKSTVTSLVALMVQAAGRRVLAGGNLGEPALDLLEQPVPDAYVLELSSFQLETTRSLRTAAAAVLNVSADHMDRYATPGQYAAAKARIFEHCAVAIVNLDDPVVRAMPSPSSRVLGFSLHAEPAADYHVRAMPAPGASPDDSAAAATDWALMHRDEMLAKMSDLRITGLHNAANALAALALGAALRLPREACLRALREFPGLPHRSQWIADRRGVRYVDDSKGTNVGATLAAVAGMTGPLILIAGGQGKGQDFTPLAAACGRKVRHVVLIGQDAQAIAAALRGVVTIQFADDMQAAVRLAAQVARAGEAVLLSPACASLDMFRDYAHRGDVFAAAVRELPA